MNDDKQPIKYPEGVCPDLVTILEDAAKVVATWGPWQRSLDPHGKPTRGVPNR